MMQTLRKKTRVVLFIALAGFALLIFFQWGLNITGIRGQQETDIAKIEGQTISYQDYRRFVMNKETEDKNVTSDQIWSMLVSEIMWRKLVRQERIDAVSDDEIWAIIQNNPPAEVHNSEYMQDENGEFDWAKYNELLRSPQSLQWLYQYEMRLREELPKEKLRSLVSTMAWFSPFDDSIALYEQTAKYDISFLRLYSNRLRGQVEITDEEIQEYFEANRDEFATPEYKVLKYVFFERKPSSYDTLDARQRLEDFIARVDEGEDFLELAQEVSDDTTVELSFDNENMLKPYMKDVYRSLRNGGISGIVSAAHGFEVMKRLRSGLLYVAKANVEVSRTTIGEIMDNTVSFLETAKDIGFDSAAVDFNLPVRKTLPMDKEKVNFPVRNSEALGDFLDGVTQGDIGGPFSSLGGYYLFALDSVIPATRPTFEEALPRVEAAVERERLNVALINYLDGLHAHLAAGRAMETIAQSDANVLFDDDIKGRTLYELRSGYGDKFAGALVALEPGEISKPVIQNYNGYIIRCDRKEVVPLDSTMLGMLQWKRQLRLQQISQELFTPEDVVDNRDKFFE